MLSVTAVASAWEWGKGKMNWTDLGYHLKVKWAGLAYGVDMVGNIMS